MTQLLGRFGMLVRERRNVDRSKQQTSGEREPSYDAHNDLDQPDHFTSATCPRCGERRTLDDCQPPDQGGQIVFTLFCRKCDKRIRFWATAEDLEIWNRIFDPSRSPTA
ncbi:MAG: hypothetical protein CMJ64_30365 [Planctomycetaceae bacterium]|nr:hypothetical protein [Planctomycetaceae bacterium]